VTPSGIQQSVDVFEHRGEVGADAHRLQAVTREGRSTTVEHSGSRPAATADWRDEVAQQGLLIRVELAEEGVGTATIAVEWPSGASSFTEHTTWVQRPGQCRKPGNDVLGWASALRECSSLLPQEKLDRLLTASPTSYTTSWSRSSGWADSRTLRTGSMTSTRRPREPQKQMRAELTGLKKVLALSPDERATNAPLSSSM
jgi:hypothetical protein